VIGKGCIKVDPKRISAIRDLLPPKSVKKMRKFLGCAGWYRRFLENYATIKAPPASNGQSKPTKHWKR